MMGWSDTFRSDNGPTLYTFSNRTSVTYDVSIVAVCILFGTFFVAFIVIFPGVRKQVISRRLSLFVRDLIAASLPGRQRFTTFLTVTLSLFVGLVILVTRLGSAWHVSSTNIVAPYRSFSREKIPGMIGAYIGLNHVNVTLKGERLRSVTTDNVD